MTHGLAFLALAAALFLASPVRGQPADPAGAYSVEGTPRFFFNLRSMGEQSALQFTDIETGAVRILMPDGEGYVAGPELTRPQPAVFRIAFSADTVRVCDAEGQACVAGTRIPLAAREISFQSDGATLYGTLWSPASGGVVPGVLLGQGSEDTDRHGLDPMPMVLAARGYAVLTYDKRGTGDTPGSWEDASIQGMAADHVAALNLLKTAPEVDPQRVGLLGFSEGSWVIAAVAARRDDIAFVVSQSGGAFTKGDAYLYKMRRRFEEQGLTGAALDEAMRAETLDIEAAARRGASGGPASGFDKRIAYDPTIDWAAVRAPVLWMGGQWDVLEDAEASARQIDDILSADGVRDHTVFIAPHANHALFEAPSDLPSDWERMRGVSRQAEGVWSTLLTWLDQQTRTTRDPVG